jgi:hypothetical protein
VTRDTFNCIYVLWTWAFIVFCALGAAPWLNVPRWLYAGVILCHGAATLFYSPQGRRHKTDEHPDRPISPGPCRE